MPVAKNRKDSRIRITKGTRGVIVIFSSSVYSYGSTSPLYAENVHLPPERLIAPDLLCVEHRVPLSELSLALNWLRTPLMWLVK